MLSVVACLASRATSSAFFCLIFFLSLIFFFFFILSLFFCLKSFFSVLNLFNPESDRRMHVIDVCVPQRDVDVLWLILPMERSYLPERRKTRLMPYISRLFSELGVHVCVNIYTFCHSFGLLFSGVGCTLRNVGLAS